MIVANGGQRPIRTVPIIVPKSSKDDRQFFMDCYVSGDNIISNMLAENGEWEPFETRVLSALINRGDFVIDAGANIGWHSLVFGKWIGAEGRLLAFEPEHENFCLLERNVGMLTAMPQLNLRKTGLADVAGTAPIYLSPGNLGDHHLFADEADRESQTIVLERLDDVLSGESRLPDFVKSDTQGSEARLMRGAQGLFDRGWRPAMMMEFWPYGLKGQGDDPALFWRSLKALGYDLFSVNERNPVIDVADEGLLDAIIAESVGNMHADTNILAVMPDDPRAAIVRTLRTR